MAHIRPAGWRELAVTGAAQREIETLALLEKALPADYVVYHGVHWTRIEQHCSAYGEIDFIIVAPDGRVLLIEQKAGFLDETPEGLVKKFQGKPRNVRNQLVHTVQSLSAKFSRDGSTLSIDYLLYCPDYTVRNPNLAGMDAARIVDATRRDQLSRVIRDILPAGEEGPQRAKVLRFFEGLLQLQPDTSALVGQAEQMVTRLAGGLAAWARQLEFSPFRLRVIGTAGSGKTQLALAEYRAAIEAGLRPLYVCYNRPLADHMQAIVPAGGTVATFHTLCDALARESGLRLDYRDPAVFGQLEEVLAKAGLPPGWQYDVLIVDEGQDFSQSWHDSLLRMLKPQGRAIWLEDPLQNLYGRAPLTLEGWVVLRSRSNFRSPRQVVDLLGEMGDRQGTPAQIEAASPFLGADVEILSYVESDNTDLLEKTKQAISSCLAQAYARSDIVLLSYHGREKSALLNLDQIGRHTLKSFTGEYDLFGNPLWREGDLLAESVYRFKGQSAPAVIFTEIDFAQLDESAYRKLFVGMTRARLKLVLVMTGAAARACQLDG
jgi:hypothetical protein